MSKAYLRFRRPGGFQRDFLRAYRLEVDGAPVGKLSRGGEVLVEVEPGTRVVQALIDWTGSRELVVSVAAGETLTVRVEPDRTTDAYLQVAVEG